MSTISSNTVYSDVSTIKAGSSSKKRCMIFDKWLYDYSINTENTKYVVQLSELTGDQFETYIIWSRLCKKI